MGGLREVRETRVGDGSLKVIPWFSTAHLLVDITRWPP